MSVERISPLIEVDALGIYTARLGTLLVKAYFRPVYEIDGAELRMAALVGEARIQLVQGCSNAADFQNDVREIGKAAGIGRALVALNRGNTGVSGLSLIVPAGNHDEIENGLLASALGAEGELALIDDFKPAGLICELPSPEFVDIPDIGRYAAACRRLGAGVSLGRFNGSPAAIEAVRSICPDIVSLDMSWFNQVAASSQARKLLKPLFRSLRATGARVHAGGLNTNSQVASAFEAGADLYCGRVLATSLPAGAYLKPSSVPLSTYIGVRSKVVQLFG